MSTFATRTITLRKALGLTQKEFGTAGDLTQSNLSNAENGNTLPNIGFIMNIKFSFPQINLNWWVSGEGLMFENTGPKKKLPANMDSGIKKFLEDLSNEVSNMSLTKKMIEINARGKKKK